MKSKKSPKSWEKMGLKDVNFVLTAGVDRRRGWLGDVKFMLLSIDKPMKTGWKPKYTSEQAVRLAMNAILVER